MKTINIYALTRINNPEEQSRFERQMSRRPYFLKIKQWETSGLLLLADQLYEKLGNITLLNFFYSFSIPKLGKEFDLLRINCDTVINIELKSHSVNSEKIKYQLQLNRNYLASLNKTIRSYTYISSENQLFRLSNSGNLISESFDTLVKDILKQTDCINDNIEQFFKEEQYLISPLTAPDRFLKGHYFLTSQQKDIKKQILSNIQNTKSENYIIHGFTGLPGTGKTLLLYDLAMDLTKVSKRACILHFGSFPDEMKYLNDRLKRIDFNPGIISEMDSMLSYYNYIFIDEGHRMSLSLLNRLRDYSKKNKIPIIISYDYEAIISPKERPADTGEVIDSLPDIIKYRLTNRIRMNSQLSSFICCLMKLTGIHRLHSYPSVSLYYASNDQEADILLEDCIFNGYTHISGKNDISRREFIKVVMTINEDFYYDQEGFLRNNICSESRVRQLFHGLNRARYGLAIIVVNNPVIFNILLSLTQEH
ncbi:MAG: ATP-binding protein [Lachnospiraceae bacterium]|nr:ATP-binding protein [Lachnospiraceae bacterium]